MKLLVGINLKLPACGSAGMTLPIQGVERNVKTDEILTE